MERLIDVLLLGRYGFHELSLRRRVILSQLPLNLTMVLTVVLFGVSNPAELVDPVFVQGQAVVLVLLGLCVAVPWDRLPYPSFLAIPLLDFIPVALLRDSSSAVLAGAGLLAVFPVMWLAGSGYRPKLTVPAAGIGALLVVWVPLLASGSATPQALAAPLIYPFVMLAIGVATSVMTASSQAQQARTEELLERSETRYRLLETIVDTVDVGVVVIGADGHDMLMNARQRHLHRAALPSGVEDAPEAELLVYREGSEVPAPLEERPAARAVAGEEFAHTVYRLGNGGAARAVSVSARQFRDAAGRRAGTVLAFADITDVLAAVRAKDSFLAAMSHEFRTPLTSIIGYTELLDAEPALTPAGRGDLHVIARNAGHLKKMVDDILAAATTGAAGALAWTRVDLAEILREAAATALPEADHAGIRLAVQAGARLPALADLTGLRRVLDNLVSNAIKYSPDGTEVTLAAAREGEWAVVTVEDQGMGMSPDDVKRAFTRFHRSDDAKRSGTPGTGLGLALAYEVAVQHGGRLDCASELGKGSTFTLRIPALGEAAEGLNAGPFQPDHGRK
ncbi:sensor histidine kinase [Sinomonas susongensis]|uniref:sensor histidine kinase n=1 Tax=Sinomonas susongensis TaxID=1324851 RepID=UPI00110999B2|nr:PAS domain-containing sensor histidine kinase [Sinomonas susongensis]